jgi:hypothetical protein
VRVFLALFLLGCGTEGGRFPAGTPGPLPPTGSTVPGGDAGVTADAATTSGIFGQVCTITDVRVLEPCTPLAGTTLTVTNRETGASAQVGDDGRFLLPAAEGLAKVTLVTTTNDRTWFGSALPVTLGANGMTVVDIPVMSQAAVAELAGPNAGAVIPGAGILVVHTAAGATLGPFGSALAFYDTGDPTLYTVVPPTGASGTALYFNVVGPATVTVSSGSQQRTVDVTVVADTLTFLAATL